ncbi:MAG: exodeoxyribonuclease V subunit beta, partial [Deltaproteobacteria bacterium]|nr:exodeoxyribonuclease V subunit beta [Deltaproteobacteria bacterium]
MSSLQPFDILSTPLSGTNLIEASAGTGKTYAIAGLYLRLILEKQFTIDQILVVTFTVAATEELKQRIRERLLQARRSLETGRAEDDFLDGLLGKQPDSKAAIERLTLAISDFDTCSIFTIHGFCQRVLHENAFETGNLFDTELVADQRNLVVAMVDDYWRSNLYGAPPECVRYAVLMLNNPASLVKLVEMSKGMNLHPIPQNRKPEFNMMEHFRICSRKIADQWPAERKAVEKLLSDPALNGSAYGGMKAVDQHTGVTRRQITVQKLMAAMDAFCENEGLRFPLFKAFHKLTATTLHQKTRKGLKTPEHPFFTLCDELNAAGEALLEEMDAWLISLKSELFPYARRTLSLMKKKRNIQHFDDLLYRVRDALVKQGGGLLAAAVRRRYRAALVDEFQDTDMLQYDIFSRLFAAGKNSPLLFMIGDPKQSIYSFRGADLFSYMQASEKTRQKYTLLTNYRSDERLVTAVNTLFSRVKKPFVFDKILFEKGIAAHGGQTRSKAQAAAFQLWFTGAAGGKPQGKAEAEVCIAAAVSTHAHGLITGSQKMNPADIAVLVRTNLQAGIVKAQLADKKVPAVIYNAGNVFESREADDLLLVLTGISDPRDEGRLKAALATSILGVPIPSLEPDALDPSWWEDTLNRFSTYRRLWMTAGFMRMFNRLLSRENVRARMLGLSNGERRLTNLLHLAELLHTGALQEKYGMQALLKWYRLQRDPGAGIPETHQLRLESDARAVKIITIHKSKGLQFPVVYCPFAWGDSEVKGPDFVFHDRDADNRLTIDLGSADMADHRRLAQRELLAENLRLLYVAVTRARERCILVWGRINGAESSALAYLLHYDDNAPDLNSEQEPVHGLIEEIGFQFRAKDDAALIKDLGSLETASNHAIRVASMPRETVVDKGVAPSHQKGAAEAFEVRRLVHPIDRTWRISSYSALVSGHTPDAELPDRDAQGLAAEPSIATLSDEAATTEASAHGESGMEAHTIFSFPKGAGAGIFFHDLFEHMDFTAVGNETLETLVHQKMQAYGFDMAWKDAVLTMTENVVTASLDTGQDRFSLSAVSHERRISELEFYFPLKLISAES